MGKRLTLIGKGSYSDACERTPTEWDFIQSLSYREQLAEEDAAFVKLVYTSRLNKVGEARQSLSSHECLRPPFFC